jgi:hypothetical protein
MTVAQGGEMSERTMRQSRERFAVIMRRHMNAKEKDQTIVEGGYPAWVIPMLKDILFEVNQSNLSATMNDVKKVDRLSFGHTDYFEKMTLYMHWLSICDYEAIGEW